MRPEVLRPLLKACWEKRRLDIGYVSFKTPQVEGRTIAPHPLVYTGMRWHVCAYCEKNREYRDFVLGRCRGEPELLDDQTDNGSEHDVEWNTKINVIFKPDEHLTLAQRSLIELNYAMTDGAVGCRKLSSGGEVGSETVSRKPEFAWRTASSSAISVGEPG